MPSKPIPLRTAFCIPVKRQKENLLSEGKGLNNVYLDLQNRSLYHFIIKTKTQHLPCSVNSLVVSILSADIVVLSLLACCACAPTGLNTAPGIPEGMKLAGIVLVGGSIAPKAESLLQSCVGCTRAGRIQIGPNYKLCFDKYPIKISYKNEPTRLC